jgi:hypothetical protein
MHPDDVIESYVRDVARRLPARNRDDVAFELRALLADELAARAEAAGRPADGALAVELLRGFGRPDETAARYKWPFTLIEPGETWAFLWLALGGGALLSMVSTATGLAWIGLLALAFAARNLVRRSRPEAFGWKPRPVRDPDAATRPVAAAGGLGYVALLALYVAPGPVVALITGGRVPASDLAWSASFSSTLRWPWLAAILATGAALHLLVALQGRWRRWQRWAQLLVALEAGLQIGWHLRYGDVFLDPARDAALFPALGVAAAVCWTVAGVCLYRETTRVRPAPAPGDPAVSPGRTAVPPPVPPSP